MWWVSGCGVGVIDDLLIPPCSGFASDIHGLEYRNGFHDTYISIFMYANSYGESHINTEGVYRSFYSL
jgi:hypothetical protein